MGAGPAWLLRLAEKPCGNPIGLSLRASSSRGSISRFEQLLHFEAADRVLQYVEAAADVELFADLLGQRHDRERGTGSDAHARDTGALELRQRGVRPGHDIDRRTVEGLR